MDTVSILPDCTAASSHRLSIHKLLMAWGGAKTFSDHRMTLRLQEQIDYRFYGRK